MTASTGRLLAVHAHPDDETLSNGALLATCAAAGWDVAVVTCTRGERGEVIGADPDRLEGDGPALARHRGGELRRALAALGVRDHAFLDEVPLPDGAVSSRGPYEDSGMAWLAPGRAGPDERCPPAAFVAADLDEAASRLRAVITERRPDVIVTYEPGGGYGHPDHVRAHEVVHRAVDLAAHQLEVVPLVLWTVVDAAELRLAWQALGDAPTGTSAPDPSGTLPSAATDGQIDLRVDVLPVLEAVEGAMRAHATQIRLLPDLPTQHVGPGASVGHFTLSNDVIQPVLRWECYRWAHPAAGAEHGPSRTTIGWPDGVLPQVR